MGFSKVVKDCNDFLTTEAADQVGAKTTVWPSLSNPAGLRKRA